MAFAFQQVSVQNPDAGVGIRVKREVRSAAEIADNLRDAVLEMWTGFNLAWSATGVVPPAETTFGEALGHTAPGLSPEDAT